MRRICILRFCENVDKCFAKNKFKHSLVRMSLTLSMLLGRLCWVYDAEKDNYDVVLDYADKALLEAKNNAEIDMSF